MSPGLLDGTLAVPFEDLSAGAEMKAYIGLFLTFREGRIVSQRNYDCYPPPGTAGPPGAAALTS